MISRLFKGLIPAVLMTAMAAFGAESPASSAAASKADAAKSEKSDTAKADYTLQPSDLIRVQVFQEEDLMREVRVTQESTVTLPLIGTVDLKDKTLRQAQDMIRGLYEKDYLVNPQINIIVVEYSKRIVKVFGSVNTPGIVLFPPEEGLTLLDAIARAGGFNRLADRKHVKLTRTNADGKTENVIINADDIMQGGVSDSWPLIKDDVIFVPERIL